MYFWGSFIHGHFFPFETACEFDGIICALELTGSQSIEQFIISTFTFKIFGLDFCVGMWKST